MNGEKMPEVVIELVRSAGALGAATTRGTRPALQWQTWQENAYIRLVIDDKEGISLRR